MGRYTQLPDTIPSTHKMHNDRQILRVSDSWKPMYLGRLLLTIWRS